MAEEVKLELEEVLLDTVDELIPEETDDELGMDELIMLLLLELDERFFLALGDAASTPSNEWKNPATRIRPISRRMLFFIDLIIAIKYSNTTDVTPRAS